jgi:hypothetical protein
MGAAKGDSFTHAKHAIAKQVYDDLRTAPARRQRLKHNVANINYIYSLSRIMGAKQ